MHANASAGAKVLPIARISIRKTGRLRTMAEARGKSSAGRQPPRRCRSQKSDGAYPSENKSAATIMETIVAPLTSVVVVRSNNNPNNHEPREIESNFTYYL